MTGEKTQQQNWAEVVLYLAYFKSQGRGKALAGIFTATNVKVSVAAWLL